VRLLRGGDELFPAMEQALAAARREVWLATYIFCDDPAGRRVADALVATAARGVQVSVVVDGFGSNGRIAVLQRWFAGSGVRLEVFRPFERWWAWLQPGQLRRMHQKLFAVDGAQAFVGGINVIDDRFDIQHGWSEAPRLDFAIGVEGPVAQDVQHLTQALWTRAAVARRGWREEALLLARSAEPVQSTLQLVRDLRTRPPADDGRVRRALGWLRDAAIGPRGAGRAEALRALAALPPVRAALVVRDNFTQRRAIERHEAARVEDVDLADLRRRQPGVAGQRAQQIARAEFLLAKVLTVKHKMNGTHFAITNAGRLSVTYPLDFEYHKVFLAERPFALPDAAIVRACTLPMRPAPKTPNLRGVN
jgi:cardiolipin synthase